MSCRPSKPALARWASVVLLSAAVAAGLGSAAAQPRSAGGAGAAGASGERRVALVVGNSSYASSPLKNPVNDARAMAKSLRDLGFEVIAHENVSQRQLRLAIIDFGDRLQTGGVGLFYFAGHGLQVAGRNYMVPVDAMMKSEREVEVESVDVAAVLARMETARNRLNIVILDACRDNPFGRSFRSASRGLASIDAPSGTMLAYATAPGRVAADGEGNNGLYTGELLKAMREPGLRLEDVFKRVRHAVREKTRGEQVPWEASSIEGDFIFRLTAASTPASAGAPAAKGGAGPQIAAVPPAPSGPSRAPEPRIREEFIQDVGTLSIRSKLPGVEVWLNDKKLGDTSAGRVLHVDNLQVGTYRVRGKKAGYREWDQHVEVVANQRTDAIIDIEALKPDAVRMATGRVLYERDFKVTKEFRSDNGPYCETRYTADGYYLKNVMPSSICLYRVGYATPDGVRIETAFKILSGNLDYGIGLLFGETGGRTYSTMLLSMSASPGLRLSYYDATKWATILPGLAEWQKESSINPGYGALNTVALELRGRALRAYVNGRFVVETTTPQSPAGGIGMYVEQLGQEAVFSYFRVTELPR